MGRQNTGRFKITGVRNAEEATKDREEWRDNNMLL